MGVENRQKIPCVEPTEMAEPIPWSERLKAEHKAFYFNPKSDTYWILSNDGQYDNYPAASLREKRILCKGKKIQLLQWLKEELTDVPNHGDFMKLISSTMIQAYTQRHPSFVGSTIQDLASRHETDESESNMLSAAI